MKIIFEGCFLNDALLEAEQATGFIWSVSVRTMYKPAPCAATVCFIVLTAILCYSTLHRWFMAKLRAVWKIFCPPTWCWDASHVPLKHFKNLNVSLLKKKWIDVKLLKIWFGQTARACECAVHASAARFSASASRSCGWDIYVELTHCITMALWLEHLCCHGGCLLSRLKEPNKLCGLFSFNCLCMDYLERPF